MSRKPISDMVQEAILLKSRRRCCLCFWLEGEDVVKPGQIAHLDQDNENDAEDNLCFLCLEHHNEYDGRTSVSKGLKESEVRKWRNELYREMEYRFRTIKRRECELTIVQFRVVGPIDEYKLRFRLKNTGDVEVRRPTVSIRLPENVGGKPPKEKPKPSRIASPMGQDIFVTTGAREHNPWDMSEGREDFFEPGGRVGQASMYGVHQVILQGHSWHFYGLFLHAEDYPAGADVELDYRVDAEEMTPIVSVVKATVPSKPEEWSFKDDDDE
jgi:hypothetical protein